MQKKWIKSLIILLIQIILWQVIFRIPYLSNFWFNHITINYNQFVHLFTSKINFPIGEIFYLIEILIIVYILYISLKNKNTYKLINTISLIYLIYNALWGVVYYKESFIKNTTEVEINKNLLIELYCNHIENAEYYRFKINPENNKITHFKTNTKDYLTDFKALENKLKNEKWIRNYALIANPTVKFSNISILMNYAGILGYYNPFTIESNINRYNTDLKMPFTIAHELAHQMGFASENQANFIAYYIGIHSSYNEVKYATYYKTMFSLLSNIAKYDKLFVIAQLESLPEGINNDRKAEIEHYAKYKGKANDAFSSLNNQFLKANNQDGHVSYSRYIELVYYYQIIKQNKSHL